MPDLTIILPDGSPRTLPEGATGADLAADIGPGLAKAAVIVSVDGEGRDLGRPLADGDAVSVVTADSDEGLHTLRHSTAHVLAQAVLDLWPGATHAIGPPIEDGFYYDFELPDGATFTADDLGAIDARMREIIDADQAFERFEAGATEALELFADHRYKREIIEKVTTGGADRQRWPARPRPTDRSPGIATERASLTSAPDPTWRPPGDWGTSPLQKVAGAYWRGDEKQPMLQRIYGTAWADKKALKGYLHRLAEAEKRDHRRLAAELDLVSWPDSLGPGTGCVAPQGRSGAKDHRGLQPGPSRGGRLRLRLQPPHRQVGAVGDQWAPRLLRRRHVPAHGAGRGELLPEAHELSVPRGRITRVPNAATGTFPAGSSSWAPCTATNSRGPSTVCSGAAGFTQDDSHIFCTPDQIPDELASLLEFTLSVLRAFGFEDFQAKLSTRPDEKSVGDDALWDMATDGLQQALESAGLDYVVDDGGGAFYGPKIDVDVTDAIGRPWQLSTLQLDFTLPERFDLEYVGADGNRHRPVMIHRALMGSIERFFGVLLEHYAGAFPLWLAPEQVRVLPVADEHQAYAESVRDRLLAAGRRSRVDPADEPLGKRVRAGKVGKIPHVLVVGDDDAANGTVGDNARGADAPERDLPLDAFLDRLADAVESGALVAGPAGETTS